LPAGLIVAAGGITYPLYLLHMQMGYTILTAAGPVHNIELWTAAIISGAIVLSWATWRFVERPAHRWTKDGMTACAARLGWQSRPTTNVGSKSKLA
jgi:peptidoglycan/LPS O-acetylase OafA/YrhL